MLTGHRALVLSLLAGLLPAQAERAPLVGTVLDPDGQPVAGAMVEVWREAGEGTVILDLGYSRSRSLVARTPTDKRGRFAVQLPIGLPCEVRVDQPPHGRFLLTDVMPGDEIAVRLEPPAIFTGRVELADGTGTPASLRAFVSDGWDLQLGRTDDQGNFRFERLPSGKVTVEVAPDQARGPDWQKFEFIAGASTEWTFTVEPGSVLTGRVTDAATGLPIQGAVVGEGWTQFKPVRTDAEGRYELRGYGCRGRSELVCSAEGYVKAQVVREGDPPPQVVQDFRLDRGLGTRGRIVDPQGQGVAGVYVALLGTVHDGHEQYHSWVSGFTDAQGHFRLQGLRPDLPPTLMIRADGWASLVYHLPADGMVPAGTITLQRPRVVRGRVVGNDGKPIARQKVGLWGTNGDREQWKALEKGNGLRGWDLLRMYVALREVHTDRHGNFAFGDLPAGTYSLVAYGENNQRLATTQDIVVTADQDPKPIEVAVPR